MSINFEQYQNKYGNYHIPSLPEEIFYQNYNKLRTGIHHIVLKAIQAIKGPNLVMKVMLVSIKVLSYNRNLIPNLSWAKLLLKEIKDVTNFIKGLQSVDGLLNFKFSRKVIVLNISGLVLFILSSITMAEKFLIDCTVIKMALTAIPIFGVLPFGGLLHISLIGLVGNLLLLSLDKRRKLEKTAEKIKEKIAFWKEPLNTNKIKICQIKYVRKISNLQKSISLKEQQMVDGQEAKKSISRNEKRKLKIHQKALEKLMNVIDKEKTELKILEKNKHQWKYLKIHLDEINPKNLQSFQKAKENKLEAKSAKIREEKKVNFLSMVNNVISISKQILVVVMVISGVELIILPFALLALSLASTGISIANYFIKKSVKEMKISPVKMKHFLNMFAH